jgi:hypothetical protein
MADQGVQQRQPSNSYPSPHSYPSPSMQPTYTYPPPQGQGNPEPYRGSPQVANSLPPLNLPPIRLQDGQAQPPPQHAQPMGSPLPPPPHGMPQYYQHAAHAPQGQPMGMGPGGHLQMRYQISPQGDQRLMSGGRHKKEIKRRTKTGCLTCRKRRIKVRSISKLRVVGGARPGRARCVVQCGCSLAPATVVVCNRATTKRDPNYARPLIQPHLSTPTLTFADLSSSHSATKPTPSAATVRKANASALATTRFSSSSLDRRKSNLHPTRTRSRIRHRSLYPPLPPLHPTPDRFPRGTRLRFRRATHPQRRHLAPLFPHTTTTATLPSTLRWTPQCKADSRHTTAHMQ